MLVLELGGNDGLRGLPVARLKANLQAIIDRVRAKNPQVKIVIAGMQIPPKFGADYAREFRAVFPQLAREESRHADSVSARRRGRHRDLNQADHIHPTAAGHQNRGRKCLANVLEPLLKESS